jgi:hypothetical protein
MSKDILVPIVPPKNQPYMHDLYARTGLEPDAEAEEVLAAAYARWETAEDVGARAEVAELLLGRRIDGSEVATFSSDFRDSMFNGGSFEGVVGAISLVAEVEQIYR